MGFVYATDIRKVSCVQFAMKYNGLYLCYIEFGINNMIYKKLLS